MNETFSVFLDFNGSNEDIKNVIDRMDKIIEREGWKYMGVLNMYRPMDELTRDETIGNVQYALSHTKWLKKYKPRISVGDWTDAAGIKDIDVSGMTAPSKIKLEKYERYYNLTKSMPHSIIIDENRRIRDGYISYLLAWKYSADVEVLQAWSSQPIKKVVIGKHVNWDGNTCSEKSDKLYCWIYDLKEAVIPGDILTVHTCKGIDYMQVSEIRYITGKTVCSRYRKVKTNETAYL